MERDEEVTCIINIDCNISNQELTTQKKIAKYC